MPENPHLIAVLLSPETSTEEKHRAFGGIVRRFQDMAFGYAYALLGSREAAEDAAQDAFLTAWQHLPQLREPAAFPGWLRRLVWTQCRRRTRLPALPTVPLEAAAPLAAPDDPLMAVLQQEQREAVQAVIDELREGERTVVLLFYVGDYTRAEIAAFLGITELAVKKRLMAARRHLKERLMIQMEDELHEQRPSRSDAFAAAILAFNRQFADDINAGNSLVRSLTMLAERQSDPGFRAAIEQINQDVQQGYSLSGSMAKHPQFFDVAYIRAVRLGEVTGTVDILLQRMAVGTAIFDTEGMVLVSGPDDPLVAGYADSILWGLLHQRYECVLLTCHADTIRLWLGLQRESQEGGLEFPELLPPLWEHFRQRTASGLFSYTGYDGTTLTVRALVQRVDEEEQIQLSPLPSQPSGT